MNDTKRIVNEVRHEGVLESEESEALDRVKRVSDLLDNSIKMPGTNFKFGIDSIIGLVPGVGDGIAAGLSLYVVYQSALSGARTRTLLRMILNVILDTVVGSVPILGDLFDFAFRSNLKNARLAVADFETHGSNPRNEEQARKTIAIIAVGVLSLVFVLIMFLIYGLLSLLF